MSVQLNELIGRIKKEGLEQAEQEAARIRSQAEQEAARIVADAKAQAERLLQDARAEAERFQQAGRAAVAQAGRDTVLGVRRELQAMFAAILRARVTQTLQGDAVLDALRELFRNWRPDGKLDYELLVSEASWDRLRDTLMAALAEEIRRGLTVKPSASLKSGFRVSEKDGSAYFDLSDEAIAEFLMERLSPKLGECLRGPVR